jgi:hypothetical protein
MRTRLLSVLALAGGLAVALSGCFAFPPLDRTRDDLSPTQQRWYDAFDFLAEQTTPWEVVCLVPLSEGADLGRMEPFEFHSFSDREEWEPYLYPPRDEQVEEEIAAKGRVCTVNVPTSVPYVIEEIHAFLEPLGLYFGDDDVPPGLAYTEIAYAGSGPDDRDIIFFDDPGLWGAAVALSSVRDARGNPIARDGDTGEIVQPATDEQAEQWLAAVGPLLDWYRYPD